MKQAEPQHNQAQRGPAQRQGGGAALVSPQGERIAQLESMAESSPRAEAQRGMMGMIRNGPRMAAQRKAVEGMHGSPYAAAQRQRLDRLGGETTQREDGEQPLQAQTVQRAEASAAKPNDTGLPDNLKNGIEALSGMSMNAVRVHYNSPQPAQLNALAYAQGTDIHVAPGQEEHLPHEAWHVVQQAQGRVQPTRQMKAGVSVNDDIGLEHEADAMGAKALAAGGNAVQRELADSGGHGVGGVMQRSSLHGAPARGAVGRVLGQSPKPPPISFGRPVSVSAGDVAQLAAWEAVDDIGQRWDELLQGVRWYADTKGEQMWFEIENESQVPHESLAGFQQLAGPKNKKAWGEWSYMNWGKWGGYVDGTLTATAAADAQANVRKNPDFDIDAVPKDAQASAQKYLDSFHIITKDEFNGKIEEIAAALCKLGARTAYSCIVSEPGKSNYWVTAKVLEQVRKLGGAPPRRIISAPAKETGEKDALRQFAIDLEGAGDLVFLDDGAYSGAQMAKFIQKVTSIGGAGKAHVGLVAASDAALGRMARLLPREPEDQPLLGRPIHIDEAPQKAMDDMYTAMDIPLEKDPGKNPDGNYTSGFYYKVPDYASVRNKFLTPSLSSKRKNNSPLLGYSEGTLDIQEYLRTKKQIKRGATEPYKSAAELAPGVEQVGM